LKRAVERHTKQIREERSKQTTMRKRTGTKTRSTSRDSRVRIRRRAAYFTLEASMTRTGGGIEKVRLRYISIFVSGSTHDPRERGGRPISSAERFAGIPEDCRLLLNSVSSRGDVEEAGESSRKSRKPRKRSGGGLGLERHGKKEEKEENSKRDFRFVIKGSRGKKGWKERSENRCRIVTALA